MKPTRRRSSHKLTAPTGVWSVRSQDEGFIVEGVQESVAWSKFIHSNGDLVLLKGTTPVAHRGQKV